MHDAGKALDMTPLQPSGIEKCVMSYIIRTRSLYSKFDYIGKLPVNLATESRRAGRAGAARKEVVGNGCNFAAVKCFQCVQATFHIET